MSSNLAPHNLRKSTLLMGISYPGKMNSPPEKCPPSSRFMEACYSDTTPTVEHLWKIWFCTWFKSQHRVISAWKVIGHLEKSGNFAQPWKVGELYQSTLKFFPPAETLSYFLPYTYNLSTKIQTSICKLSNFKILSFSKDFALKHFCQTRFHGVMQKSK